MNNYDLSRRLVAEFLGVGFLLATVVGSGIMGEAMAGGNAAIALLGNTLATGAILVVLILILGPISGAHLNPAVTVSFVMQRQMSPGIGAAYVAVQVCGGLGGVMAAHVMFGEPVLSLATQSRAGFGQWVAEFIATFGLVATIIGCLRFRPEAVAYAVGLFISAGYWFTSSTSFANPAVAFARAFSDTFTGIRLADSPAFMVAEFCGAAAATLVFGWLLRKDPVARDATGKSREN